MKKLIPISILGVVLLAVSIFFLSQRTNLLKGSMSKWSNVALMSALHESYQTDINLIDGEENVAVIMGAWRILFSKSKDQGLQLRALQETTSHLKMDITKHSEIDLRFNKVIIRSP